MTKVNLPEIDDLPLLAEHLHRDLDLRATPVAVRYQDGPARDTPTHGPRAPSVCTFFVEARDRTFQADVEDHTECEIGAYVHGVPPAGELGHRLTSTVGWMEKEHYLAPGEAASIPHHEKAPNHAVYGPMAQAKELPTAVLFFVRPKGMMLVTEATRQAWPGQSFPALLTRPMCSILPVLTGGAPVAISVGCAGSRLYTQMGDDEVLAAVRGDALLPFADAVHRVRGANDRVWSHDSDTLAKFQRSTTSKHNA